MDFRNRSSRALFLFAAIVAAVALSPALSGCVTENAEISRMIASIGGDAPALSQKAVVERERFDAAYDKYARKDAGDRIRQLEHFTDAYKRMRVAYVREVPESSLIDAAVKGIEDKKAEPGSMKPRDLVEAALDSMTSSLDPHSAYYNPDEFRESRINTRGEFGGLGIRVMMESGYVKVVSPIEETPAMRAGMKPGDLITHIDTTDVKGKTLMDAVRLMRGRPGTDILLTVHRPNPEALAIADAKRAAANKLLREKAAAEIAAGKKPTPPPSNANLPLIEGKQFDVTLTRAIIKVKSVRWHAEGNIGYVKVNQFNEKVDRSVRQAVDTLNEEVKGGLKGFVLDLRSNPGGLLSQSVALSDAFLGSGAIVSVRGRQDDDNFSYSAESGDLINGLPMVVLVNGGSASASEIVAGALQDHGRAVIMGRRTFGKGSVQTIMPLPVEGALKLTTALYYSPKGRAIQARGVEPDITLTAAKDNTAAAIRRHEADLPGALPAVSKELTAKVRMSETACPKAGKEGKDRMLGCALELLQGSLSKFLAAHDTDRKNM